MRDAAPAGPGTLDRPGSTDAARPAAPTGFAHLDAARSVRIETPEHVPIGFELAGIGSRGAAVILDVVALGITASVLAVAGMGFAGLGVTEWVANAGFAVYLLVLFALQWGYFFVAEGFFNGRTLGKHALGLRVVGEGGTRVTLQASALRNLVRFVDIQPVGTSLVGLGLIALHPRAQRLGDMVAGTVVVRDRRPTHEIPEMEAATGGTGRSSLEPRQFDVLAGYIRRRDALPKDVRRRLAGRVADAMEPALLRRGRLEASLDQLLTELHESEEALHAPGGGANMQAVALVRAQAPVWKRFRSLTDRAGRRGLAALDEEELAEFTSLYREVSADFARARTYGGSLQLCFHLESLVGEAHNLFYRGGDDGFDFVGWLRRGFPAAVRRNRGFVLGAAALLFLPAAVTWGSVTDDPELGRRILPPEIVSRAEESGDRLRRGEPYVEVPSVQMSVFSSSIMTNNLQVAFLAAAGGILAGLGTVAILVLNGIHLGSVFGMFGTHGGAGLLWSFVHPHGVLELTAITISGGAGLILGWAVLAPGRRTRGRALREDGRVALSLLGGAGVLLVLAGLVEGFVSPARLAPFLKEAFSATVAVLLALYLAGVSLRGGPAA